MSYTVVTADPGTGGPDFNVDTNTGVATPIAKIAWGVESTITPVTAAAPLPVVQTGTPGLPTGAATETTLASVLTALQLIDNIVSGAGANITQFAGTNAVVGSGTATGALRVELANNGTGVIATVGAVTAITNALPAGTNAIGKLAANSGVDIGDVDVTSCALPTGASTAANQTSLISPGKSAAATFTPAAASHVANDCNGAAAEFALSAISAGRVMITSAWLEIDGATAEATAWRLYLYDVTPPSAIADDGAWTYADADRSVFLGFIELGTAVDYGPNQWVEQNGINKQIKLAGTSVFGYLVNLTTLTPQNVAHKVTLHGLQV